MPNDQTLSIIVKLQDEASAGLQAMADRVSEAASTMGTAVSSAGEKMTNFGKSMMSVGSSMSGVGQQMSIGITLPILAAGKAIVETSMKFESSMELIRTQAGATQGEVDSMTKSVLAYAKSGETSQGPEKLAEGLYHLESLGYRGQQAMDALKISAQAADLGIADMEATTNSLGAAMVTGIKGTEDLSKTMGILDATIGQGNMRMDDLNAALGTGILPAAKNFGLSLQDVGAALATLTDNGMRADESATRLRMTFSLMAAPTQKAADALATIGLSNRQLADDMRNGGIVTAIQDLNDHLNAVQPASESVVKGTKMTAAQLEALQQKISNTTTQLKILQEEHVKSGVATDKHNLAITKAQQQLEGYKEKLSGANKSVSTLGGTTLDATQKAQLLSEAFGGGRTSAAILTLTQQVDRLKTKYDAIGASADSFNEKVQATHETNFYKMNAAMAQLQSTMIDIGGTVMPIFAQALEMVAHKLQQFSDWWDTLSPGMQSFIIKALMVAAALGPVLVILGSIISAIGGIIAALGGLTTAFMAVLTFLGPVGLTIIAILAALAFAISNIVQIGDLLLNHWKEVWAGLKIMFKEGVNDLIGMAEAWANSWVAGANMIIKALNSIHFSIPSWVPGIGGKSFSINIPTVPTVSLPRYEFGGYVNAPRGTEVPAILHGGETVIPAEASAGRAGGNTVNITIVNPSIRSQEDIRQLRKEIDSYFRPLLGNAKLIHV